MNIICLPETYLDSTVLLDNDNLEISRYILNRCDHPLITKRGAVCLYCKNCLPQRVLNISYFKECLNFKLKDRLSSLKTWHFLNVFGLFSPLKKTIQFPFMFNLYFQQKGLQVVCFSLLDKKIRLNLWRCNQVGVMNFVYFSTLLLGSYISL